MKRNSLRVFSALAAALLVMGGSLSACAESAADLPADMAGEQVLNLPMETAIATLDVNAYGWTSEYNIIGNCQEGLFRVQLDEEGNEVVTNAGCEEYEVSEDGAVYTFHLRENFWSDGEPVKASDYVNSYLRALDSSNGFNYSDKYFIVKNGQKFFNGEATAEEVGIKALDDRTLEITVEKPSLDIITTLVEFSFPIRMDKVEAATTQYGTDCSEIVYSGPFMVTDWVADSSLTMEKNPYYWDSEHVYLDKIAFSFVQESSTQALMFDSQQFDMVTYNDDYGAQWNEQAEAGAIQKTQKQRALTEWLIYKVNDSGSGLMKNAKIRKALSLAIDRQELVDTVYGRYEAAYDIVPPAVTVQGETFNVSGEGVIRDQQEEYSTPEALQELLKEGLAEENYAYDDLSDVVITYLDLATTVQKQTFIEYLKQTWEQVLGITVETIVVMDWSAYGGEAFDMTSVGWNGNNSPDAFLYMVDPDSGLNANCMGGYYTEEEVELVRAAKNELDPGKYAEMYQEIETRILEDAGVCPLYYNDYIIYEQNYVKGVQITNFGVYNDFSHAYISEH